ncbi:MAG: hypothetical protein ABSA66_12945 [Roseiarcus sp.]|jgi:Flp pilus assembly pilin Flp
MARRQIGAIPSGGALDAEWTCAYSGLGLVMIKHIKVFVAGKLSARTIDYALSTSLTAVFIIYALLLLGAKLSSAFIEIGAALH